MIAGVGGAGFGAWTGDATALAAGRLGLERPIDEQTDLPMIADHDARTRTGVHSALEVDPLLDTLGATISGETLKAIVQTEPALRAALVLGSPDFMRR